MINFIAGTIFGIIAATVGFVPIAQVLNGGMVNLQKTTIEITKPQLPSPQNGFNN